MVRSLPTGLAWLDRLFDVRVDDHPEPLRELRRLVGVQRAYGHKMAGDSAFARGELERGTLEYEQARSLLPDNLEFPFWHAFALLSLGRTEQAAETFREVFSKDRNWAILGARVARSGLMPCDNATAERVILQAAREADALGIGAPRP
jgi:tetratricopeptide (TPR) repeat protein